MEGPIVLIRPYRPEDYQSVQKVLFDGTMAPVNTFFVRFLTKEIFYQTVVMISALMFIFGGVPLYWTVSSLPIVTCVSYFVIWFGHFYKAKYTHRDMANIERSYMNSNKTCFLVAEAYVATDRNPSDIRVPVFINEAEFQKYPNIEATHSRREIIGTVGICRDREFAVTAWIRRMAVKKEWRRLGVGSHIVDSVIKFCTQKGFVSIELVTTECHDSARRLYEKKGFEMKQMYHKKILNLSSLAITMFFMNFKTRPHYSGTAVEL